MDYFLFFFSFLVHIRGLLAYCVGYDRFSYTFLHLSMLWIDLFSCVLMTVGVFHPPLTIVLFLYILCSAGLVVMNFLRLYLSYRFPSLVFFYCFAGYINLFCLFFHWGFEVYHPPVAGFFVADESSDVFLISLCLYELTILLYSFSCYFIWYYDKSLWSCIFGILNDCFCREGVGNPFLSFGDVTAIISLIRLSMLLVLKHSSFYPVDC